MTRIIAGTAKGRQLATPKSSATRPTTDRVREAAFAMIAGWADRLGGGADDQLAGLSFLDLYAGTGAVAFEAASRGAGPVWAVESQGPAAAVAQRNRSITGLAVTVKRQRVEQLLGSAASICFDIVWADPPYALAAAAVDSMLRLLADNGWLAPEALVVVERSARDTAPSWPAGLLQLPTRNYGETSLHLAVRGSQ
ncbi:MAG: 16S rRNA (guanine(966)-N(2))-methyltransferase RsmD [Propionibacteriaceae bacterium]|jgi:16S rRNA (guanine966-N2)-methyltransferase|nr:16S rRNA (guanine(966)-N(2))-methyltransferase RsmD [Propionibacteriaceae bacterium]